MQFQMLDEHENVKSRRNIISINRMSSLAIQFSVNALEVCDRHQCLMILFIEKILVYLKIKLLFLFSIMTIKNWIHALNR